MHIGEKIRDVHSRSGLSVTDFAKQIDTVRENAYAIFKRKSIDTRLLQRISDVLNYDFFQHYVDKTEMNAEVEGLRKRIEELEKEVELLTTIRSLMEDRLADYKNAKRK